MKLLRSAACLACLFLFAVARAAEPPPQTLPPVATPFPAPDFDLRSEAGKRYRLSELRGKVVVLNFWATWCPPCRYEMPAMQRAWEQVQDQGIVILAVNVGEDEDTIFAFTGRYPVDFPLLMDQDSTVIGTYPVIGLPTTFIIDPAGRVTHRAVGGREWDDPEILEMLRSMLKLQDRKP